MTEKNNLKDEQVKDVNGGLAESLAADANGGLAADTKLAGGLAKPLSETEKLAEGLAVHHEPLMGTDKLASGLAEGDTLSATEKLAETLASGGNDKALQ